MLGELCCNIEDDSNECVNPSMSRVIMPSKYKQRKTQKKVGKLYPFDSCINKSINLINLVDSLAVSGKELNIFFESSR